MFEHNTQLPTSSVVESAVGEGTQELQEDDDEEEEQESAAVELATVVLQSATPTNETQPASNDDSSAQNLPRHRVRTMLMWLPELLGLVASIAATGAIIALLAIYGNRPLSTWKSTISINTVVAILGTVSRTSLALGLSACLAQQKWNYLKTRSAPLSDLQKFDAASRGPWGSLQLLLSIGSK
jgi:hypothetical protein